MNIKMKSIIGSWSPVAHYKYSHNCFKLTVPFIHPFDSILFTQLKYNEHSNQIEVIGFIPNREYNKNIYNNIPTNIIVLK
jgi:hypothetical protein